MLDFSLLLHTQRTLLRPIAIDDYESIFAKTQDHEMWKYFTSDLSKHDECHRWILSAINETAEKRRLAFTIIHKESGEIIGSTSFGNISQKDKRIEIGWTWIANKFHGTGINVEIKKAMINHCFATLHYERVESKTDVLNIPARKSLLKAGMTEEGILRSHTLMTNNRRRDTIFYSILKKEWEENQSTQLV